MAIMTINQEYEQKRITMTEAIRLIHDGDYVVTGTGVFAPIGVMRELHHAAEHCNTVHVMHMAAVEPYPFLTDPQYKDVFDCACVFSSSADRMAYKVRSQSYVPAHLSEAAVFWMDAHRVDIAYVKATPMDEHGHFHLAPVLTVERDAIERAHTVVLEVSPHVPYTYGDTLISLDEVDYVVETDIKVPDDGSIATDETSGIIGEYIADLIHDGDCIQLGIGAIPNAVARSLRDKHHLGIHTELFVSSMAELMECGAVDNNRKNYHPGKSIACFTFGTQRLYDFIDHNPDIEFYRATSVIDPRAVMQNDNMVSVNTAFGCDLTGQVTSEGIGAKEYSGVGGQFATAKGAVWAKNGRSIIAFRSTANLKSGVVSNINASFAPGTAVTLSRNDVDIIVTEYGVAYLRGRSVHERVGELIRIAHPDFRDKLRYDVSELYN